MKKITCPRCWNVSHRCDKCSNSGLIYDSKLTSNFTLGELTYSQTARKRGIPNDPTVRQVVRINEFVVNLLQPLRDQVGLLEVTSGFRSPELNSVLPGSSPDSAHMLGYAADVQPGRCSLTDLMRWFRETQVPFDQAILEYGRREESTDDDWLHVGYKNAAGLQRRQLLVMRGGKYSQWAG